MGAAGDPVVLPAKRLALGDTPTTVGLLVKHEIMFLIIGGCFVIDVDSSLIQGRIGETIAGPRLFYLALLHLTSRHHRISEPTVVVQFQFVSIVLALMGLPTIRVR